MLRQPGCWKRPRGIGAIEDVLRGDARGAVKLAEHVFDSLRIHNMEVPGVRIILLEGHVQIEAMAFEDVVALPFPFRFPPYVSPPASLSMVMRPRFPNVHNH